MPASILSSTSQIQIFVSHIIEMKAKPNVYAGVEMNTLQFAIDKVNGLPKNLNLEPYLKDLKNKLLANVNNKEESANLWLSAAKKIYGEITRVDDTVKKEIMTRVYLLLFIAGYYYNSLDARKYFNELDQKSSLHSHTKKHIERLREKIKANVPADTYKKYLEFENINDPSESIKPTIVVAEHSDNNVSSPKKEPELSLKDRVHLNAVQTNVMNNYNHVMTVTQEIQQRQVKTPELLRRKGSDGTFITPHTTPTSSPSKAQSPANSQAQQNKLAPELPERPQAKSNAALMSLTGTFPRPRSPSSSEVNSPVSGSGSTMPRAKV